MVYDLHEPSYRLECVTCMSLIIDYIVWSVWTLLCNKFVICTSLNIYEPYYRLYCDLYQRSYRLRFMICIRLDIDYITWYLWDLLWTTFCDLYQLYYKLWYMFSMSLNIHYSGWLVWSLFQTILCVWYEPYYKIYIVIRKSLIMEYGVWSL